MSGEIALLAHVDTAGQCEGEERLANQRMRCQGVNNNVVSLVDRQKGKAAEGKNRCLE